jgi:hypothetical protein
MSDTFKPVRENCIFIVDVDNILWLFDHKFREIAAEAGTPCKDFEEITTWGALAAPYSQSEFYELVNKTHAAQKDSAPLAGAAEFVTWLHQHFYVLITSHRRPEAVEPLAEWLHKYGFVYDELHVSFDKTKLFDDPRIVCVIDDNPSILSAALDAGIGVAISLKYPWNVSATYNGDPLSLFEDFNTMQLYLEQLMQSEKST